MASGVSHENAALSDALAACGPLTAPDARVEGAASEPSGATDAKAGAPATHDALGAFATTEAFGAPHTFVSSSAAEGTRVSPGALCVFSTLANILTLWRVYTAFAVLFKYVIANILANVLIIIRLIIYMSSDLAKILAIPC